MSQNRVRSPNAPLIVHLAILAAGLVTYSLFAARSWFFSDDWYFLTQHPDVIWSPHVGHWSTVPALVFLTIQRLFGMDNYLPFALPAIIAHLVVVHLVWRITIRSGVRPWLATAFSVLLAFLGAGAEAIAWAVQIGFVGAIAGMLGAIILLDRDRLTPLRGVCTAALALLALASSGVALPFGVSAVALAWARHGFRRAAAVFIVPFGAYLAWFLIEGRTAQGSGLAHGFTQLIAVPQFAVSMLSDGLGRMFPLAVLGGLVFVALAVWWIFTIRLARTRELAGYLLFVAAPLFALLTGYARVGNGLVTATSTRYVYVAVVAVTPFMSICFDRATRKAPLAPAVTLVLLVAAWNIGGTAEALNIRADRVESIRLELARTAAQIRTAPHCLADRYRPSPTWAPDVTVADIRRWMEAGWYNPPPSAVPVPQCVDARSPKR